MITPKRVVGLAVLLALAAPAVGPARAQRTSGPLNEQQIARMVKLKIKGEVVASMIQKQGLAFTADDAVIERIKEAGAPDVVLDAVRQAGAAKPAAASNNPVTYQDVVDLLNLGVPEAGILERLKQSPTTFTLSKEQTDELKRIGATEALLGAMAAVRTAVDAASEISNLALVFDCSGSMSEQTAEGRTKMQAAREAAIKLVQEIPEGVRLAFIIYGQDRAQECNAVQVVRPLEPLDNAGRNALVQMIGRLQPVGSTPIALALRTAGRELAKANATSGLVLISDGKEMCGGNPAAEAAALTGSLKLDFGVQVVGFGVKPDERQALGEIAQAGKGKYYDAPTPAALRDVIQMLAKRIEEEAKPAPEASRVAAKRRPQGQPRFITVQRPAIQFPPMEEIQLLKANSNDALSVSLYEVARCTEYGQRMRIPPVNRDEKFDLRWVPKDKGSRWVKMAEDLAVPLDQAEVVVKPEGHLGLVRLIGKDLPATKQVFLSLPSYGQNSRIRPPKMQTAARYGQDLVVPAGTYNLWIEPVDEKKPEVVAEKVKVVAGRVTVIE